VRESGFESELLSDPLANGIEFRWAQCPDGPAPFAEEIFVVASAPQSVEPGAVSEVNVSHKAVALERLQIPIHGRQVEPRLAR